jgi:hypothetical protein
MDERIRGEACTPTHPPPRRRSPEVGEGAEWQRRETKLSKDVAGCGRGRTVSIKRDASCLMRLQGKNQSNKTQKSYTWCVLPLATYITFYLKIQAKINR